MIINDCFKRLFHLQTWVCDLIRWSWFRDNGDIGCTSFQGCTSVNDFASLLSDCGRAEIFSNHVFLSFFGQFWPAALLVSLLLCGSLSMKQRDVASVGASTATSTFKAAAGGKMSIKTSKTYCFWTSVGEKLFEELKQFLFDVFESACLMKKHHFWRVVKDQSVGYSEGNFLHPTPGCLHNSTLCWSKELRCRCGVMFSNCPAKMKKEHCTFLVGKMSSSSFYFMARNGGSQDEERL